MNDIMGGWDTQCCGEFPGGIWWDKVHSEKATASNGGPIVLAARLYQATLNITYLQFAEEVYAYWWQEMVNHTTGHVCDHIDLDGYRVCDWEFTYNEGIMIGAAVELFKSTHNATYLSHSSTILHFVTEMEIEPCPYGNVLSDGGHCNGDCVEFKGIAYRYISEYYQVTEDKKARNLIIASANSIWNLSRNTITNLFGVSWCEPPSYPVTQGQQNAATMALNIFARLCYKYPLLD